MNGEVSDEMLMAYVDGELDEAARREIGAALEADHALRQRAERFRRSREIAREAYGNLLRQPVPERLVGAILSAPDADGERKAPGNVIRFPARRRLVVALPLAASIALAIGYAGYMLGRPAGPANDLIGRSAVARALPSVAGGESEAIDLAGGEARLTALSSFRVEGGVCRMFDLSGEGVPTSMRGIACERGGGWTVDIAVALAADGFAPASDGLTGSLDAYLDALEADGPLSPEEEAALGLGTGR